MFRFTLKENKADKVISYWTYYIFDIQLFDSNNNNCVTEEFFLSTNLFPP